VAGQHSTLKRAITLLALLPILASCGMVADNEFTRVGFPEPATKEGPGIITLWQGFWIVAIAVGLLVIGLIVFASIKYRRKSDDEVPQQVKYNIPIEILYTVVPLIIVLALFGFTAKEQNKLTALSEDYTHVVNVVGFRWSWAFNYIDNDVYETGTPGVVPTLYLPVDEKVRFELSSPDVIHSFWIPSFLFKMDIVPGALNRFELTPDRLGTYVGKCAELCGQDHARMLFNVKVVERPEYDQYIESLRLKGQTGMIPPGILPAGESITNAGVNR
jgi:cytochrome c oxidase subunit 2